jgi:hypothetical protein
MSRQPRRRVLAFEQLELKASPSSILLLLATGGEQDEATSEVCASASATSGDSASTWRFAHDTQALLRFIDDNTVGNHSVIETELPTETECAAADEMMKLDDTDLRTMIVLDTFGH